MTTIRTSSALAEPPTLVGRRLLDLPEDQWFERKSARTSARDLGDILIGFGNAEGGTVVVGLWGGRVEGTDSDPERRNDQMQAAVDFCAPPVRAHSRLLSCARDDDTPDHLLVIDVEPSETVVHANQKDMAFLRIGDENRRLSFAQRQELIYDRGQGSYEARPSGLSFDAVDEELLEQYRQAARAADSLRLLQSRALAIGSELTVAGCLLFASNPQAVLPESYVRVLKYRGTQRGTGVRQQLVDDIRIEGPIPRQLVTARERIRELQPTRRALREVGRFGEVGLVPQDAWLEGVVNAAIHRSYSLAGDHTRVEIFDDRIEITSPGRFPGIVGLSDPIDAPRYARNPRIARVCADLDFGQELGEGIRRMYEEMRLAGLNDPLYSQTSSSVHLVLSGELVDRALDARLPAEARRILAVVRGADHLSTGDIASAIGMSRPATIKRLNALKDEGLIEWIGNSPRDPRAYWRLP